MSSLEVPVFSIESALAAQSGGADRIEFCSGQAEGGLTPSYGNIIMAKKHLRIPFHVMIRPRAGDFFYTDKAFELMRRDILVCKELLADGVVFGMLDEKGHVDKIRCKELVEFARPMSVTFHRAFDLVEDPFKALEDIVETGFDRILTSGMQKTAIEGAGLIAELVKNAGIRIIIMPGAGINASNLSELKRITKACEFHASCKMLKTRPELTQRPVADEFINWETDAKLVRQLKSLL